MLGVDPARDNPIRMAARKKVWMEAVFTEAGAEHEA